MTFSSGSENKKIPEQIKDILFGVDYVLFLRMNNQNIVEKFKDIKLFIGEKELTGTNKEIFINFVFSSKPRIKKAIWLVLNGYAFHLGCHFFKKIFYLRSHEKRWKDINLKMNGVLINKMLVKIGFDKAETIKVVCKNEPLLFPLEDKNALYFFANELPGYLLKYNINEKDVVVDLGAYCGWFSIYASKMVGDSGKVIAFEPDSENLADFKNNLKLNNSKNIILVEKGTWNNEGEVAFEQVGEGSNISNTGKSKIKVTTLDQELRGLNIPFEDVKFIKMDIEGAELETIDGMREVLLKGKPSLAVASYHIRDGEKTHYKVEQKLKQLGYHAETDYPEHLTTYAFKD